MTISSRRLSPQDGDAADAQTTEQTEQLPSYGDTIDVMRQLAQRGYLFWWQTREPNAPATDKTTTGVCIGTQDMDSTVPLELLQLLQEHRSRIRDIIRACVMEQTDGNPDPGRVYWFAPDAMGGHVVPRQQFQAVS